MALCPITTIEIEQVKFDLQKLEDPEIKGCQYQQGTLFGYEVREYLLQKWGRACAYCGVTNTPLQIEHIPELPPYIYTIIAENPYPSMDAPLNFSSCNHVICNIS
jgi:hypothetical protein